MVWAPPFSRQRLSLPDEPTTTERLVLRPLVAGDGKALFTMESDRRVADAIPIPVAVDRSGYLAKFTAELDAGIRFKFFRALAAKADPGEAMGWLFLRPTEDGKDVEVGYRLSHKYWGQGLVPEACHAMLELGFEKLGLERIVGYTLPSNLNSHRVFEKLGFRPYGTKIFDDHHCLGFALDRTDWRHSQPG